MSGWLDYPRIPARAGNYATGRQGYAAVWMIIHCTDDDYADTYPTSLGHYWQREATQVSVNFCVSDTETRQYVSMDDTAFQCRNPGNLRGVGVELSGLSAWTRDQWLAHRPMLTRAATLCAEVTLACGYDRTVERLPPASLLSRQSGLTQHADLTATFGGTHTDLGADFPWDQFSGELATAFERLDPARTPAGPASGTQEDDMFTDTDRATLENVGYTLGVNKGQVPEHVRDATQVTTLKALSAQVTALSAQVTALAAQVTAQVDRPPTAPRPA